MFRRTRSNAACYRRNGVGWSIAYSVSFTKLIDRNFRFYFSIGLSNRRGSNHSVPPCIQSGYKIGLAERKASWLSAIVKKNLYHKIYSETNSSFVRTRAYIFQQSGEKQYRGCQSRANQSYRILYATKVFRGKNFRAIYPRLKNPKISEPSFDFCSITMSSMEYLPRYSSLSKKTTCSLNIQCFDWK